MDKLIHLLLPRESNNHKAKLLHSGSLLILAISMVFFQAAINFLPKYGSKVLGFAAQISPEEVIRLTNQKRAAVGLPSLTFSQTLSSAAYTKGRDMIDRDYWAHVSPDGTQPWKFFSDFGYRYRYAGENLARDFSSPTATVDAWMNSPTHRENILNPKYKEIGIGVIEGDLAGVDTTLVVQFFGSTYADNVAQPVAKVDEAAQKETVTPAPVAAVTEPQPVPEANQVLVASNENSEVLVSPFTTTRSVSVSVVGILLLVFIVDAVLVSRRKIVRIGGRTLAHTAFLAMILLIVLIIRAGSIL
jgi:hypothetical protein